MYLESDIHKTKTIYKGKTNKAMTSQVVPPTPMGHSRYYKMPPATMDGTLGTALYLSKIHRQMHAFNQTLISRSVGAAPHNWKHKEINKSKIAVLKEKSY